MATAPVTFVTEPRIEQELDAGTHRRTGREKIVMYVQVGASDKLRPMELTEAQLLRVIMGATRVLESCRQRREQGQPLPGSGEITNPHDVDRIPGDL